MVNLLKKIDYFYKLASVNLEKLIIEGIKSDENWQVLVDYLLEEIEEIKYSKYNKYG